MESIAVLGLLTIVAVVALTRWSAHRKRERAAQAERDYRARLLNPDWALFERHLGRPVPTSLREALEDRDFVLSEGVDYSDHLYVSSFAPIDAAGLRDSSEFAGTEALAFAHSEMGDPIHLLPGADQDDTVYITFHDGGDREVVASSAEVFVERLRRALAARD